MCVHWLTLNSHEGGRHTGSCLEHSHTERRTCSPYFESTHQYLQAKKKKKRRYLVRSGAIRAVDKYSTVSTYGSRKKLMKECVHFDIKNICHLP